MKAELVVDELARRSDPFSPVLSANSDETTEAKDAARAEVLA
jgi:hypothetical protein